MRLEILQAGNVIETRDLEDGSYSIGRASSNAIQLKSPQISKNHGLLVIKGGKAAILDVGSSNGIFVNGILVRKQRINLGDEIVIGPFQLQFISQLNKPKEIPRIEVAGSEGNAARKLDFSAYPEETPSSYRATDKMVAFVDDRLLVSFYGLIRKFDWRLVLGTIVGGSLLLAVLLSAWPFLNWGKMVLVTEATARGHAVLRQCVRDNYRVLAKTNDLTRLTVEGAEKEPGVLGAYIVDPTSKTMVAPAKFFNKPVEDLYTQRAIEKLVKEEEREEASVERSDGTLILAQPIYSYEGSSNRNLLVIAMLEFEIPSNIHSTFTPLAEMALLAIFLGLISYFLLFKMMSYPVTKMLDQVDAALKGETAAITSEIKFPEFETLAQNLTFAMSRIRAGEAVNVPSGSSEDGEDQTLHNCAVAFDAGTTDAILLLDPDKKVRFIGRITEELLSMRSQYAIGQNISDACRDQSFSGTAIDLCDQVIQSLGEPQNSTLEINGVSRQVTAVSLRNRDAQIRYVLITVKMNG